MGHVDDLGAEVERVVALHLAAIQSIGVVEMNLAHIGSRGVVDLGFIEVVTYTHDTICTALQVELRALECLQVALVDLFGLHQTILCIEYVETDVGNMILKDVVRAISRVAEGERTSLAIIVLLLDAAGEQDRCNDRQTYV